MDNFDNLSICSELSNNSECLASSNASSLSGLSAYCDEYLHVKHLINSTTKKKCRYDGNTTPKANNEEVEVVINVELYEERIKSLNSQLQNSLKQNEKYKSDLYNLEKRIELSFYDKIEKLLRCNNQLETNLETANKQIERLIKNQTINNKNSVLEKKLLELERNNHELNLKNILLNNELTHNKNEKNLIEIENQNLRIEFNDLKIELKTKISCIQELKTKISEQHIEIQNILQNNSKSFNKFNDLSNELEQVKKSEKWFTEQLHQCQKDKRNLLKEIGEYKQIIANANEKNENLNLELRKSKLKLDEIQLKALKRDKKEIVILSKFEGGITEQLPVITSTNNNNNNNDEEEEEESNVNNDFGYITNYYEATISDLTEEVVRIKQNIIEQQEGFETITKQNSELLSKCVVLEKNLQQNEVLLEEFDDNKKDLTMKLCLLEENKVEKDLIIVGLKNLVSNLKIELTAKDQEKEIIENSVSVIREQFRVFKDNYEIIKKELVEKNKKILQLESEKQELFMNNNWNLCELEKIKEKDFIINQLEVKIVNLNKLIINNKKELELLKENNLKFEEIIRNSQTEAEVYENTISQLKDSVFDKENDITNLQKNLLDKEVHVKNLEDNLNIVKDEMNKCGQNFQKQLLLVEKNYKQSIDEIKQTVNNKNMIISENISKFLANNFINLVKIDDVNILQEIIIKLCKLNGSNNSKNSEYNNNNKQIISNQITKPRNNSKFKQNEINKRIKIMEGKCKILQNKNDEALKLLQTISKNSQENSNSSFESIGEKFEEEIKHLKALLEVKDLEKKELRKRYEINNRTLLRKVKEHMKGRNLTEKHNNHLQEIYNKLFDDYNTLKLQQNSKEYEIENLININENYSSINKKLKQSLLKLEKELIKSQQCDNCIELKSSLNQLEITKVEIEENKNIYERNLILKDNIIDELRQEIQKLLFKNGNLISNDSRLETQLNELITERNDLISKLSALEESLSCEKEIVQQLNILLLKEKENCSTINNIEKNELVVLSSKLEKINERNKFLCNELEIANSIVHEKCEELKELKLERIQFENNWLKKREDMENLIITLKMQLEMFRNEINAVKNEKFFMQRLCNDLKIALKTHVNHNKLLKEQIVYLSQERNKEFNSLPNILLPSLPVNKFDDAYINELLKQSRAPLQDKPLEDLQLCLSTLKKEILMLQQQIVEKNVSSSQV